MARMFVAGDINLDVFCTAGKLPEKHHEIHMDAVNFSIGGNAANFAVAAGLLGLDVELSCVLGNDFSTPFLLAGLERSGVKTGWLKAKGPNGCSVVILHPDGEKAIMSNKGAAAKLSAAYLRKAVLPRIRRGDVFYAGGYFHVTGLHSGMAGLLADVRKRGATVVFDMCYDTSGRWMAGLKSCIRKIDIIFLNGVELRELTGESDREKAARSLLRAGPREVVLKLGREGSVYFSRRGGMQIREKALKVKPVDSTGCGDVFNAGFMLARFNGLVPRECLAAGNYVAGKKCGHHGLVLPDAKSVMKYASMALL